MKARFITWIIIMVLTVGVAQADNGNAVSASQQPEAQPRVSDQAAVTEPAPAAVKPAVEKKKTDAFEEDYTDDDAYADNDKVKEERVSIADPIEPFNRAMGIFNDRMYFWVLKPVAQGYKAVTPEPARISIKNFFFNLRYPSRLVSCLLQTDFEGAATETGRFLINTVWGLGGLMDPASQGELNIPKQDTDLGQTLGVYGVGHGFYIVWPFLGPSSPRDSVDYLGDQVLYPLSYTPIYVSAGTWGFEKINKTSFHIGDYESLLGAAIDPYIAVRDAYIQYRAKEVKTRKARSLLFRDADGSTPASAIKKE